MKGAILPYYLLFFTLPLLFAKVQAQTNWYVAPNGMDVNGAGTFTAPFATVGYAAGFAQPGDTVFVRGGVYRNPDFGDGDIWKGENAVKITAQGAPGNYITFMPYQNEWVQIEFDGNYGVLMLNASYLRFQGFEVKGISDQIDQAEAEAAWGLYQTSDGEVHDLAQEMNIDPADPALVGTVVDKPPTSNISKPGYYNGRGIVSNSSHHIEITGNVVRDVPSSAIRAQQSDHVRISGNEVFGNTYWTTMGVGAITVAEATPVDESDAVKIILEKNIVHHNENRLISWSPAKDFVKFVIDEGTGLFLTRNADTYLHGQIGVFNNLSLHNGASGIVCHVTNGALIAHNTVFRNGTTNHGKPGGIALNTANNVLLLNNIAYARTDKWALGWLSPPGVNVIVGNNLLFNENGSEDVQNNLSEGWIEADPLFVDAEGFNFNLTANSPAIDAGSPDAGQSEDLEGSPRNDGQPDIGAFEFFPTGLGSAPIAVQLEAFPNPFRSQVTLKGDFRPEDIRLFDAAGREQTGKVIAHQGPEGLVLMAYALEDGPYFLQTQKGWTLLIKTE